MLDFVNEMISCYGLFVDWLFSYAIGGIPVAFIMIAGILFMTVVNYILKGIR